MDEVKSEEDRDKIEKQPDVRDQVIFDLRVKLELEKYKTRLYESLFKKMGNFPIDFLIDNTEVKIGWKNSIPVSVLNEHIEKHPSIKMPTRPKTTEKRKRGRSSERDTKEKVVFRTAKASLLTQVPPQKEEEMINKAKITLTEMEEQYGFNISISEIRTVLQSILTEIKSPRIPAKKLKENMEKIRLNQTKLLGKLKLDEYITELKTNLTSIEQSLTRKGPEILQTNLSIALSPLDQRFLFFGKYYDTEISPDDFERFQHALFYTANHPTRYIKFSMAILYSQFENYGSVIFDLRSILKRIFVNINGFNSIVYVQQGKSTTDDPFTFYRLDEIGTKGERKWKMENRLYEFCAEHQPRLLRFLVDTFRKIYFTVFNDNNYRPDYRSKAYIFQMDCDQLIVNLFYIANINKFSGLMRRIVKKYCTLVPTNLDKFDYLIDETDIRHKNGKPFDDSTNFEILFKLFDTITKEECIEFLESRNLIEKFIQE